MEGVDIHLDVNVGKQLSALGHTLTTLTGYEDDESINLDSDSDEGVGFLLFSLISLHLFCDRINQTAVKLPKRACLAAKGSQTPCQVLCLIQI